MPAISTMVYPAPAYVRVETNWADYGWAQRATVYRVDCVTGVRVPLRPYVCFDGDFLDLSCGYGIFWDTEPQLDRCVYYCTQAQDAAGNLVTAPVASIASDNFNRVNAATWNTSSGGQIWTSAIGAAADFSVTGTRGQHALPATTTPHLSTMPISVPNYKIQVVASANQITTGNTAEIQTWIRADGTDQNGYRAVLSLQITGQVNLFLQKRVAGVITTLASTSSFMPYTAGGLISIAFQAWGSQISLKAWDTTLPEPAGWALTATDTSFITGGTAQLYSVRTAGNTNAGFTIQWDDFVVTDPCQTVATVEKCSDDVVVPSSGDFRFGDPVRPCNDVTLLFDAAIDPDCVPTQGIFFGNMDAEVDEAMTGVFAPVNAKFPIIASRTRGPLASTLTVATKTFPDRDALRALRDPGSPLLLRGPAQYGIDDRYMTVGNVTETRPVSDHRVTPRMVALPHVQVARPSGPTQGVCGARVKDLCDIYSSWDAMAAAGLTFADLLRGKASHQTPLPDTTERTWTVGADSVNSTYASWNAVNAGNTDWNDLKDV